MLRNLVVAARCGPAAAATLSLSSARSISFFNKIKLGERPLNLAKKEKYAAKFARATKTRMCAEFRETGECVWGDRCLSAHSLSELKPPVFFDRAVELAKGAAVNHHHLLEAQFQQVLQKKRAFRPVLDSLRSIKGCEMGASLMVQYVPQTLLNEQMVEKAYIQVKVKQLQNAWFLTDSQVWALKQVVGQRYNPDKDVFKLTRRNQRPYREILDEETVYDHNIKQLYEIARLVREFYPEHYVDADNCAPVRASTSFTPEYTFEYDQVRGADGDEVFESPFADETNALARPSCGTTTPAFGFEMDQYRAPAEHAVHFVDHVLVRTPTTTKPALSMEKENEVSEEVLRAWKQLGKSAAQKLAAKKHALAA